jgi:hypothetical protein
MLRVQIDLILRAVQPEGDSSVSLTAIKVIDKQDLYLMGHVCSIPLTDLVHQRRQSDHTSVQPHRCAQPLQGRSDGTHAGQATMLRLDHPQRVGLGPSR